MGPDHQHLVYHLLATRTDTLRGPLRSSLGGRSALTAFRSSASRTRYRSPRPRAAPPAPFAPPRPRTPLGAGSSRARRGASGRAASCARRPYQLSASPPPKRRREHSLVAHLVRDDLDVPDHVQRDLCDRRLLHARVNRRRQRRSVRSVYLTRVALLRTPTRAVYSPCGALTVVNPPPGNYAARQTHMSTKKKRERGKRGRHAP